jgi:RimJ/RimL family protein N-acetyltransferase
MRLERRQGKLIGGDMTLQEQEARERARTGHSLVLTTERLILRAAVLDDARAIAALINDRRIAGNMVGVPHPYTLQHAKAAIAAADRKPQFVVALMDDRVIGGCGLAIHAGHPELGYWLGVSYWGNGYATEAARALIDFAFTALDCTELRAGAIIRNPASRRVLEKCGFQWTGVKLQRIHAIDASVPSDRFRLDCARWASLRRCGKLSPIA